MSARSWKIIIGILLLLSLAVGFGTFAYFDSDDMWSDTDSSSVVVDSEGTGVVEEVYAAEESISSGVPTLSRKVHVDLRATAVILPA